MSSVNIVQSAEPKVSAPTPSPARGSDPFDGFLESAANTRGRDDAPPKSTQRSEPTAPTPRARSRSESVERGDTPQGAPAADARRDPEAEAPKQTENPEAPGDTAEVPAEAGAPSTEKIELGETTEGEPAQTSADAPATPHPATDTEETSEEADAAPKVELAAETEAAATPSVAPSVAAPSETPATQQQDGAVKPSIAAAATIEAEAATVEATPTAAATVSRAPVGATPSAPTPAAPGVEIAADVPLAAARTTAPAAEQAQTPQPAQNAPTPAVLQKLSADAGNQTDPQPLPQRDASHVTAPKAQDAAAPKPAEFASPPIQPADAPAPRAHANPALPTVTMPEPVRALATSFNPATLVAANANAANPVPLRGTELAAEIVSRMRDGMRRFDIRLDPPELGRVDVRLEVDRNGHVTTRLTVDRPETLELLQREARGLERALQQSGLKTDEGGLEFSLRQQTNDGQTNDRASGDRAAPDLLAVDEVERSEAAITGYRLAAYVRGGVDIRV